HHRAVEAPRTDVADGLGRDVPTEVPGADHAVGKRRGDGRPHEIRDASAVERALREARPVDAAVEMLGEGEAAPGRGTACRARAPGCKGEGLCAAAGPQRDLLRDGRRALRMEVV